ncbi:polysaccharide deacetylase family protein [Streptomyces massasporeus]
MAKGVHGSSRVLGAVLVVAALASAATGCSESAEPDRGAPAPAAGQQARAQEQGAAGALNAYVERVHKQRAARVLAAKKWGLAKPPLEAPAPPAVKPKITTRKGFETDGEDLPPVFTTVPTKQKIVFLTIDDGSEKDPELLRMMKELKIPYSAFLSDYVVKDDYGYFARMQKSQESGVSLHNHTLNHRYLPGLSYKQQKREICGMQDVIEKRFGTRPPLFRPPYGNYNEDTLRLAAALAAPLVLWFQGRRMGPAGREKDSR